MGKKIKVVFVGGTKRALNLYSTFIIREDIEIVYSIFMKGYPDEYIYCDKLVEHAKKNTLDYIVSDIITDDIVKYVKELNATIIVGGGIWRSIIPDEFLTSAVYGYIGLHGSGLPSYRGWAGINWYIINGEKDYVLRMLQLSSGIDDGPLITDKTGNILEYKIALDNEKHVDEILKELYPLHIKAYNELLDKIIDSDIGFLEQDHTKATYTCNRSSEDGEIDWRDTTKNVFNFIRAQSKPYNGAYTFYNGEKITLWRVKPRYDYSNYIGRIEGKVVTRDKSTNSIVVLTKDGGIEIFKAESENGETDLLKIFNSVRKRCKSEVEAFIENFKMGKIEFKDMKSV